MMKIDLELKGVGPHADTHLVENVKSLNMVIFAENGSGKSFISKSFKRISERKALDESNVEAVNSLVTKSNAMISFGEKEGSMSFSLRPESGMEISSSIHFSPNNLPEIKESNEFIFHVFNSEYVRENLANVNYRPEDNVKGFVLGKVNIDLSKEKQELSELEEKGKRLRADIEQSIKEALSELRELGVQQNTTEYRFITLENVQNRVNNPEQRSYEDVRTQYESFLNMPEGINDVPKTDEPNIERFDEIATEVQHLLEDAYTLSYFEDEFKKDIISKQEFVEKGVALSDGIICPFCGQPYSDEALNLIDRYTEFLKDEEASVFKRIQTAKDEIRRYSEQIAHIVIRNTQQIREYNTIRQYFPSFSKEELTIIDDSFSTLSEEICRKLDEKKRDIRISITASEIAELAETIKKIKSGVDQNNTIVARFNNAKNNGASERLSLRKALCTSKYNQLLSEETNNLDLLHETREAYKKQRRLIEEKESQARIDKRELVISELKEYLDLFFGGKYQFDSENFCISFKDTALIENTDDVLSDGEKSILAFCFYLANVHAIVQRESDYERILFIIDDPVSSLDFNYVYNVAQTIRNIDRIKNLGTRVRFIVLTHNMEFMSILVRNKIAKQKFVLSHGHFEDFKDHYVMPYMSNLMDIYKVANGAIKPNHTTPNSIRHLLETIYRFEGSVGDFEDYISSHELLRGRGFLYSLVEDQSHGGWRESTGYTEDAIIDACKGVIDYINVDYPGQIGEIERVLGVI